MHFETGEETFVQPSFIIFTMQIIRFSSKLHVVWANIPINHFFIKRNIVSEPLKKLSRKAFNVSSGLSVKEALIGPLISFLKLKNLISNNYQRTQTFALQISVLVRMQLCVNSG